MACQTRVILSTATCQTELRSRTRLNCVLPENSCNTFLECSQEPSSFQECRAVSWTNSSSSCLSSGSVWEEAFVIQSINWSPTWNSKVEPQFLHLILSPASWGRLPELRGSSWPQPSNPRSSWCQLWSLPLPYITACNSPVPPRPGQTLTHRYTYHNLALLHCAFTSGTELHKEPMLSRVHLAIPYSSFNVQISPTL